MKVVKLSVHKNTLKQRRTKQFRKDAIDNFKLGINAKDVVGYAYIAWNKEGDVSSGYSVSDQSPFPTHSLPEVAKLTITERLLRE